MELVTFLLPEPWLGGIDKLVKHGRFNSRSEAFRFAIKEIIKTELWRAKAEIKKTEIKHKMRVPMRKLEIEQIMQSSMRAALEEGEAET